MSTNHKTILKNSIAKRFDIATADFKSLEDDLKLNIKLVPNDRSDDLLEFLTQNASVKHYKELIPNASEIFIQTVKNNGL